jgi:4-amino-4-deoxy-L-arabinose transferase-like glycosyltransferase
MPPPDGLNMQGGMMRPGGGGAFNIGTPGLLRFFQSSLSGQISWWFPLVGVALLAFCWRPQRDEQSRDQLKNTLFWGAWLLPMFIFFSFAGFFHQYYLAMLAPGVAALSGAGLVTLWHDLKGQTWRRWLLPLSLLATAAFQTYIYYPYEEKSWLLPTVCLLAGLAVLTTLVFTARKFQQNQLLAKTAMVTGLLSLLVAPAYWAATPMLYGGSEAIPYAGPELQNSQKGMMMDSEADPNLVRFLQQNYKEGTYLLVTTDSHTASPLIIETGLPVMAMGGFSGTDPAITIDQLQSLAEQGKVKYFMLGGMGGRGRGQTSEVTAWIQQNCQVVPSSEYQSSTNNNTGGMNRSGTLYEYVGN